jgi:hypothetical protein
MTQAFLGAKGRENVSLCWNDMDNVLPESMIQFSCESNVTLECSCIPEGMHSYINTDCHFGEEPCGCSDGTPDSECWILVNDTAPATPELDDCIVNGGSTPCLLVDEKGGDEAEIEENEEGSEADSQNGSEATNESESEAESGVATSSGTPSVTAVSDENTISSDATVTDGTASGIRATANSSSGVTMKTQICQRMAAYALTSSMILAMAIV